ncbi:MAG TPA: adenylyl-sulfate kinase [Acidimicrobiia bacterium]|nr:adenylyl-sulfate kinase [Acidimicrobiia bacterium]
MAERTGSCVWLTGRAGAGKTTIGVAVAAELRRRGVAVALVDEPDVSAHLSPADPIASLAWLARLLTTAGVIVVMAADDPRRSARDEFRAAIPGFVEIFVDGGAARDHYEEPVAPELRVPTHDRSSEASVALVVSWLERNGVGGA